MMKSARVFLGLFWLLAACARATAPPPTPGATASPLPAAVLPESTSIPTVTATPAQVINGELFSKISHSTSVLHQKCDPLEIIFGVTAKNPEVAGVVFFFRLKDKATGLVNEWSGGGELRAVGNSMFEFNFRASAIPNGARYYQDAWVQYQFMGIDKSGQSLGRTQIFSQEITYTPDCP
jgi:hypothetical protein